MIIDSSDCISPPFFVNIESFIITLLLMPELPEVETVKQGLQFLIKTSITACELINSQLRWPVDPLIPQKITQQCILDITRRAKYIVIKLRHGSLIIHLGMTGVLYVCQSHVSRKKHDHVIFTLSNNIELRYHDVRRFGSIHWAPHPIMQHRLLFQLGPEPLSDSFNPSSLHATLSTVKKSIKSTLLDQKIVVGIGNIYANEILFAAGIHPCRLSNSLRIDECKLLVKHTQSILTKAIALGGTTLKDFLNPQAKPGYFQQTLHVYGRKDQPCTHCHTNLAHIMHGQRTTVFCPTCQK
ncbi:MAG: bifunctional DNA-formamidopyrimidine glycosylase/DNA-(apurinic or apyrimidinic site) lyase [Pseudomonadota bacterium]|nr:bifunctional DNA-formamidopyrimidine glycosylase/DNA-(apurinic or apyrimidinic site) lyase [Pseudomonadota bacterium]